MREGLLDVTRVTSRWRFVCLACGAAGVLALAVSLLLPKRYTSECRILIDPPAGSDFRVTTAVTPVYLESLSTYELFASSDELFLRAANRFGLRRTGKPLDSLKRQVLKIELPRNTKVLEVRATLEDATRAHDLALYIAQQTVELSRAVARSSDEHLAQAAERAEAEARARVDRVENAWGAALQNGPVDELKESLDGDIDLRGRVERRLVLATADLAGAEASHSSQTAALRAGNAELQRQIQMLDARIARKQTLIASRSARLDRLEAERSAAAAELEAAVTRLNEMRGSAGLRSERLSIIDSGAVPDRPSFPNVPLNVMAAIFAALVLSVAWIWLAEGPVAAQYESGYRQFVER